MILPSPRRQTEEAREFDDMTLTVVANEDKWGEEWESAMLRCYNACRTEDGAQSVWIEFLDGGTGRKADTRR